MGGAYVSLQGDPASAYYNPAGLAGLYRQAISLSASAYWMAIEQYGNAVDFRHTTGERITADAESLEFDTFPASVVYVLPLGGSKDPDAVHHVLGFALLVPHFDQFDADIVMPPGESLALEIKASFFSENVTYWAGPSWAMAFGRLRLGLGVYLLLHLDEERFKASAKARVDDGLGGTLDSYLASATERSSASLTALAQAGIQVDVTDRFTLGAAVRTRTFGTLYSQVEMLTFNSAYVEDIRAQPIPLGGYVDRLETTNVELHYRLPWMFALGASYRVPESFAIALDLSLHLPQGPYDLVTGPPIVPVDASGNPVPERAVNPTQTRKNRLVFNANLGTEVALTDRIWLRGGVFTDMSSVDQDFYDNDEQRTGSVILPSLFRVGVTLGLGMIGDWSTSSFGVVYVAGFGETFGLETVEGEAARLSEVNTHTITVVLAGSADL
jgi:hypothetical protein